MQSQETGIRRIVTAGLLLAVTLLLALTNVGFIPVPTPAGSATISQIPAIIAGVLEGPLVGLFVSFGFGVASFLSPLVPVKDPLVIILPRLAIGVVAAWVYLGLRRASRLVIDILLAVVLALALLTAHEVGKQYLWLGIIIGVVAAAGVLALYLWKRNQDTEVVGLAVAGVAGSLTNTVFVLGAAVLRHVAGITPEVALGIGLSQGIPEAIVSAIVVVAVVSAVRQVGRSRQRSRLQREDDR